MNNGPNSKPRGNMSSPCSLKSSNKDIAPLHHNAFLLVNNAHFKIYAGSRIDNDDNSLQNSAHVRSLLGCRQAVRHRVLIPAYLGSNPSTPATLLLYKSTDGRK